MIKTLSAPTQRTPTQVMYAFAQIAVCGSIEAMNPEEYSGRPRNEGNVYALSDGRVRVEVEHPMHGWATQQTENPDEGGRLVFRNPPYTHQPDDTAPHAEL